MTLSSASPGEVTEIASGVYSIATDYPEVANCPLWLYLVRGRSTGLIDAGVPTTYAASIVPGLRQLDVVPGELDSLLVTHAHPDHSGGARTIRDATSAAVAAPLEEVAWVEDFEREWKEYWQALFSQQVAAREHQVLAALAGEPVTVDRPLRDGETIDLGDRQITVVQTRGHTRAHCAFLDQRSGALFSGDAVQGTGTQSSDSTNVFAPMYADVGDYVEGLRKLRSQPFDVLCPGHGLSLQHQAALDLIDASLEFALETVPRLARELLHGAGGRPLAASQLAAALGRAVGTNPPVTQHSMATARAHLREFDINGNGTSV